MFILYGGYDVCLYCMVVILYGGYDGNVEWWIYVCGDGTVKVYK